MKKNKIYIGLADCHGIESLEAVEDLNHPKTAELFSNLNMRATVNSQRHAVTLVMKVTENQDEMLHKHLTNNNVTGAVRYIKSLKKGDGPLGRIKYLSVSNEKMWNKIPNPKLDPYE